MLKMSNSSVYLKTKLKIRNDGRIITKIKVCKMKTKNKIIHKTDRKTKVFRS